MEEIWKDVIGYEGLYQISSIGRVKCMSRVWFSGMNHQIRKYKPETIKSTVIVGGYEKTVLCKDGKSIMVSVHRLVAEAFIPNPLKLPEVNHKDEVKKHNNADNLEWCDSQYNNTYGTRIERSFAHRKKPVNQFLPDGTFVQRWNSATEVEQSLGFNNRVINYCMRGRKKTYKGFIWKYA